MVVSFPKSLAWFCLNSLQIFISALVASILYLLVFLRLRGIVRARAPSTSIASAKEELHDKYEHRLARQMLLYPVCIQSTARPSHLTRVSQIAYTIMIIPILPVASSRGQAATFPSPPLFSGAIYSIPLP